MAEGFDTSGLMSLLGQMGKSAPGIFQSLNAGQTASNPYLQNYYQPQQMQQPQQLLPMQQTQFPQESFAPMQNENDFRMYNQPMSLLHNRNRMSGGFNQDPMQNNYLA